MHDQVESILSSSFPSQLFSHLPKTFESFITTDLAVTPSPMHSCQKKYITLLPLPKYWT